MNKKDLQEAWSCFNMIQALILVLVFWKEPEMYGNLTDESHPDGGIEGISSGLVGL